MSETKSKEGFTLDLTIPLEDLAKRDETKKNLLRERTPEIIETIVQNTNREKQSNEKEELEEKVQIKQENIEEKVVAFSLSFICMLTRNLLNLLMMILLHGSCYGMWACRKTMETQVLCSSPWRGSNIAYRNRSLQQNRTRLLVEFSRF